MNIYAKKGDKVVVTMASKENGYDTDIKAVEKYLIVGREYTVDRVMIGGSRSSVCLQEFPDLIFNTVMFEDAKTREDVNMDIDKATIVDYNISYVNAEVCEMLGEYRNMKFINRENELIVAFVNDRDFICLQDERTKEPTSFHLDDLWHRVIEETTFENILEYPRARFSVRHELIQGGSLESGIDLSSFLSILSAEYANVEIAAIIRDGEFYLEDEEGIQ